ncbi:ribosome recycling factor [Pseudomonadota bacterium]|nr:ribosome recycling factor [Pseudomonadota bacterium]
MMNTIKDETTERMQKCMDSLSNQFNKIRTGRANPSILDSVKVDYYGNQTPINQTANISVEENRTLVISPWDKTLMPEIEKAIISSDLGLNPSSSGDLIRITMPTLTEETRQDYIKQARTEAENARISIRSVRRDSNQTARDLNTKSELSDDELRDLEVEIQEITDKFISMIDDQLKHKEDDLIQI